MPAAGRLWRASRRAAPFAVALLLVAPTCPVAASRWPRADALLAAAATDMAATGGPGPDLGDGVQPSAAKWVAALELVDRLLSRAEAAERLQAEQRATMLRLEDEHRLEVEALREMDAAAASQCQGALELLAQQVRNETRAHDKLRASVTSERNRLAEWKERVMSRLAQVEASVAPATRGAGAAGGAAFTAQTPPRRALSEGACALADRSGEPQLQVHGVCQCTEDLVVGGRSIAAALDNLTAGLADVWARLGNVTGTTAAAATTAVPPIPQCTNRTSPFVAGTISGDTVHFNGVHSVATSPDGMYIYVTGYASDSVAVVDVGTDVTHPAVVGSVAGDTVHLEGARGVAVSPDGQYVFVAAWYSDSLVVFDVGTNRTQPALVGAIVGDDTHFNGARGVAVAPDGRHVYVAGAVSDSLVVVDVGTNHSDPVVVGSITGDTDNLDGAFGVVVSPDGQYAYVTGSASDSFIVVDVGSNPASPQVVGSIVDDTDNLANAHNVAVSADGYYAYVASRDADSLTVVDVGIPTAPQVIGGITDSTHLDGAMTVAVSPVGDVVFVTGFDGDSVAVVNVTVPTAPWVVGSVVGDSTRLGSARGLAVSVDGKYVYVAGYASDTLAVVDVCGDVQ